MAVAALRVETTQVNPLDMIEQIVAGNDWPFERRGEAEMAVEVPGRWCDYSLYFSWREDLGAMHFTCAFDMRIPDGKKDSIHELLVLINEKMWLGHFGLWVEEGVPMFRHAAFMRGTGGAELDALESVVDIALAECERFYPAFQYAVWGGKPAQDALTAAMVETVGEA